MNKLSRLEYRSAYGDSDYECDQCNHDTERYGYRPSYRCDICDIDICSNCAESPLTYR